MLCFKSQASIQFSNSRCAPHKMKQFTPLLPAIWFIYLHHLLFFTSNLVWFQHIIRTASALRNETDRLTLLNFKESISNDPYQIMASWNSSTHFCNWPGITCSHRHQRVSELILRGYHLRGIISPHIGNLSFLRGLDLRNNSFNGEVPQELGRLFRLSYLVLADNTLAGEIPMNLTRCFELTVISLDRNNFTGKIPTEIGSLWKLQGLYISRNNFIGQIPTSIGNLTSLLDLGVGYNNLEGNLPEEISHLKNLEFMAVVANKLSGTLPSIYNISSLTKISIAENQFHGSFPANMFLILPSLIYFEIGLNQFSGPIPTSITNASLLQALDISQNHFEGQVPSLRMLRDLWWLNLNNNSLGGNSAADLEFLTSLTNCSKLETMDIGANNFVGQLSNFVGNLSTQVSELTVSSNKFSGHVPVALENLINLITIDIEDNALTDVIPTSLGKLQKLQLLSLYANKLTGDIPDIMHNLTNLFILDLSTNSLEGNIPPSIGNCHHLQFLDLSVNNLKGFIPLEVMNLSSLKNSLNLSRNTLSGTLPVEVGKLRNIGALDLSENHLSGAIPGTVGDCQSLEYLYLQGNSFQEIIPSSLASLKGLRYLDLSRNNLSGSIPKDFQNISVLEYLNVSFNMLDGEVPTEGVFRNASAIAVIGNRNICGGISELQLPSCSVRVLKQKKHHNFRLLAVIICVIAFLFLLSSIVAIYLIKKRNQKSSFNSSAIQQLRKVSYRDLHRATDGFSACNMVGSGGFGSVYKGTLESDDRVVAIKVLNLQKKGAHKSFIAECNALKNIRHRNLVKILTCCSGTNYNGREFKALVFEYMKNGSLEEWLHPVLEGSEQPRALHLDQRLNIILDISSALHYLHCECEQPVIHCDLKPSNVLLDDNMFAYVSDFGLARLLSTINGTCHEQTSTIGIKGTIGYAPPEYGLGSEVSTEGDIYSFGILILEMLTGRRPSDEMFKDGQYLHQYVENAFPGNLLQIVDPHLEPRHSEIAEEEEDRENLIVHPKVEKCLVSLCGIGLACSHESPKERMGMAKVNTELNLIRNSFLAGEINGD